MTLAAITLCPAGAKIARDIARQRGGCEVFVHESVATADSEKKFASVVELTAEIFGRFDGLVFVMPCGVAVRAVAPNIRGKLEDPAVVVVDVGGRWAISLLSGHEGGANSLAFEIANFIGAEPIVTTTTEAARNIIVGVGCRKGTSAQQIIDAISDAVQKAGVTTSDIRIIASVDIKRDEQGLIEAAEKLNLPMRFISSDEIRNCRREFQAWQFVEEKVNLPAVAEPAALLAGKRTELLLSRQTYPGVTIAIARENFSSLE